MAQIKACQACTALLSYAMFPGIKKQEKKNTLQTICIGHRRTQWTHSWGPALEWSQKGE